MAKKSSSLIDNIFTNDIEEKETAGILLNHLSDHQIIYPYIEKLSYIEKVPKCFNAASIQNCIREMQISNVYDELNKSIDSNPEHNYGVLLKSIKGVKDKCLPKKLLNITKRNTKHLNG